MDKSGWPKWISDAYDALMADLASDSLWVKTIKAWTDLERNHEFSNPTGSSATFRNANAGRPDAVSWWFRNRKPVTRVPPDNIFGQVSDFSAQWWKWWSVINPTWRERDNTTGRLVINENDDGDWSMLIRPGQCGILTVLLCLFWWRQHLTAPSEDWNAALQDVSWVIDELIQTTK
ncbi:hypothetical protein EV361DRAFT_803047 [Lentinula raphanica]|nr:hypothetical protein FB446DRAFT_655784 [Lentinula raphanica]KAJ3819361.1 hypothetical protein F5880DRAFT_1489803 [Lentinula raphanica]KAJ3969873.1 hypothetical protein EV361DRAFT_803047 [Lentinula raphanica]